MSEDPLAADLEPLLTRRWLLLGVGNELPRAGLVARLLDGIRWGRICRRCR